MSEHAQYTVKKSTARVYKINVRKSFGWTDVFIDEWSGGGRFLAVSAYGNFGHAWEKIGEITLRELVSSLDYGEFMKKTHPSGGEVFSLRKSCDFLRKSILRYRRDDEILAEEARDAWKTVKKMEEDRVNEDGFYGRVINTGLLETVYEGDSWAVKSQKRKESDCERFWEEIMPILRKIWAEELAEERKAS